MRVSGRRNWFIIGFVLVLIGLGLGIVCLRAKRSRILPSPVPREKRYFPTSTPKPIKSTLSLSPQSARLKVNQSFAVDVLLDTKGLKVDAADVVLQYNPSVLQVERVLTGNFFDTFPVVASQSGRVQISALVSPKEGEPQTISGKGKVGTIIFKGVGGGTGTVRFAPECVVAREGKNVLGKTIGGHYIIR